MEKIIEKTLSTFIFLFSLILFDNSNVNLSITYLSSYNIELSKYFVKSISMKTMFIYRERFYV